MTEANEPRPLRFSMDTPRPTSKVTDHPIVPPLVYIAIDTLTGFSSVHVEGARCGATPGSSRHGCVTGIPGLLEWATNFIVMRSAMLTGASILPTAFSAQFCAEHSADVAAVLDRFPFLVHAFTHGADLVNDITAVLQVAILKKLGFPVLDAVKGMVDTSKVFNLMRDVLTAYCEQPKDAETVDSLLKWLQEDDKPNDSAEPVEPTDDPSPTDTELPSMPSEPINDSRSWAGEI